MAEGPLSTRIFTDYTNSHELIDVFLGTEREKKHDFVKKTINYLKVTELEVGLIANFGEQSLKYRRVIYTL